jgi:methylmalonyl-CoA mutase
VSSQAAAHKTLVPALTDLLRKKGAGHMVVAVGGVIPPQDYQFLRTAGADAIFGPGTKIPAAALDVLQKIENRQKK